MSIDREDFFCDECHMEFIIDLTLGDESLLRKLITSNAFFSIELQSIAKQFLEATSFREGILLITTLIPKDSASITGIPKPSDLDSKNNDLQFI